MIISFFLLTQCSILLSNLLEVASSPTPPAVFGPSFPTPSNLVNDPIMREATKDFQALIKQALSTGTSSHGEFDNATTAFSFDFYSTADENSIFEYHHSPPLLTNVPSGVKTVDRNTIYRIGSVTKLLTVYSFLIQVGDAQFHDPITKYVPELLARSNYTTRKDSVHQISWSDVTIGALASHMAGVGQEYGWLDIALDDFPFAKLGLPQLKPEEAPVCGAGFGRIPCTRKDFLRGFASRDPVFPTFQTPVYSNGAFQILAYALQTITGKEFGMLMEEGLFHPLGLSHTSYIQPNASLGVIPGNQTTTFWNYELGELWPSGGLWSSTDDITTIGRSILDSSLLDSSQTRRWMKPMTHTSSLETALGSPWEIQRSKVGPSGRIVDLYSKNGKLGAYGGYMILVPDYNVGFTILAAGAGANIDVLAGFIVDVFLPALEEVARTQASQLYAGTYNSSQSGDNSTFTLTTDANMPGLELVSWLNNGTSVPELLKIFIALATGDIDNANAGLNLYLNGTVLISADDVNVRLYPTGLRSPLSCGGESVSFRAVFSLKPTISDTSPFSDTRAGWAIADLLVYGKSGLDEFIFTHNAEGLVTGVENPFLRQVLVKV
ncbi:beta-lactamase/transpeptidase-like protein [Amylocarpus encephaloides]|uniref:Beta-lactamase/transpeptidase-like protein n=1 Tax=Amylocarpus encephaloides TaxID=45428 RepID=A0A9P7YGW6_9HELO|nr:beta-lactamase/transpeptidase-like protein [Amylocarpus encephaloides]